MSFESGLKEHQFGISLDPFRCLFVVPDFAWKTKKKEKTKTTEYKNPPQFSNGRNKNLSLELFQIIISRVFLHSSGILLVSNLLLAQLVWRRSVCYIQNYYIQNCVSLCVATFAAYHWQFISLCSCFICVSVC